MSVWSKEFSYDLDTSLEELFSGLDISWEEQHRFVEELIREHPELFIPDDENARLNKKSRTSSPRPDY